MKIERFNEFNQINEAKSRKVDYVKKFSKKVDEVNEIIKKAKKDEIRAIETDSTWESEYVFDKVELLPTKLKVYYTEYATYKPTKKVDEVKFSVDKNIDFDETRHMFKWIKKTIRKGYKAEGKEME